MKASRFVCGSSLLLAGWLAATFYNDVPSQRYPKLDKAPRTAGPDFKMTAGDVADRTAVALPPAVTR